MPPTRSSTSGDHDGSTHPYRLGRTAIRRWTIGIGAVMAASLVVPLLIDAIWGPLPSALLQALGIVAIAGLLLPLALSAVLGGYAIGPYGALAGGVLGAGIALVAAATFWGLPWVTALIGAGAIVAGGVGLIIVGRRNAVPMWINLAGARVARRNTGSNE